MNKISSKQGKVSRAMHPKKSESETKERRRRTFSLTSLVSTPDTLGDDSPDHKTSAEIDYDVTKVKQSTKITAEEASEVSVTKIPDNRRRKRSVEIEEEDKRLKMGASEWTTPTEMGANHIKEVKRRNITFGVTDTSVTQRQATDSRGKMESLKFQFERELSYTPRSKGPLWTTRWRTSRPCFTGDKEERSGPGTSTPGIRLGTCSRRTSSPKVFNFAWRQQRLNLGCVGRSGIKVT